MGYHVSRKIKGDYMYMEITLKHSSAILDLIYPENLTEDHVNEYR